MVDIKNIDIKYKSGVIFGIISLVLSLLTGILSGVGIGIVFLRALIMAPIFPALGFGIIWIIQKYIPEFNGVFSSADSGNIDTDIDDTGMDSASDLSDGMPESVEGASDTEGGGFSEMPDDEYPRVSSDTTAEIESSFDSSGMNDVGSSSGKKLGKHIIADENSFKYEPKLMAEAVRTMMSKDGE